MIKIEPDPPKKRPEFLTVLCILTFVGSSFGIMNGLYKIVTADFSKVATEKIDSAFEEIKEREDNETVEEVVDFTSAIMHKTNEKVYELATCNIVGGLLCLGGALLMFRLRKIGFYAYLTGQVVDYLIPIVILDVFSFGGLSGTILAAVSVGSLVVPIVLCILYVVNFKHMQ